ncbi:hypothetical protein PGT21_005250 [Puccinia graminis f. sp. tritici]|uniref:Secreted protein n=1 Tax=Puccinia graminis f. sp. tritici TaxID=56615 RepID=A0A5B0M4C2_PUCGR|nr:hypothetical protein PGT21_005250 [Puccinia graminis f. sp. tritici]KAA1123159.1 hypothetical protein PGTUg99_017609 [Puccinia graminis f. sp. tritici]
MNMLPIHQIPFLALLLSATAWSYPRVHLDQASNPILGSNDPRPIAEDGITKTLGKRTTSNPGEADDDGAKTQLLKFGPTVDGASLKADIAANPKLTQETNLTKGAETSHKPDANDNNKTEKIEEKIKKQELKIEQLKKKLKKEEERLVKLQQDGKKGTNDESKLLSSPIKSQATGKPNPTVTKKKATPVVDLPSLK